MGKITLILLIATIIIGTFLFNWAKSPVSSDPSYRNFVINQGEGINIISTRLQSSGLVRNKYIFLVLAHQLKLNNQIQAGLFKLSPSMSTGQIVTKLSSGGNNDYWLKIIEGQRLSELNIRFDPELEGFVFPDSYLVPQDYQPQQIYTDIIKKNFDKKIIQAKINATNTQMSESQIITLASLLEREGRSLKSKQEIASIILNRLSINMALQIDATVQYARDSSLSTKIFWLPLTKQDLSIDSPFNTYKYPNLPPSPICNPGYDAIYAAYHPIESGYIYYLTGTDGLMHYATTLSDHNANIARYLK